MSLIKAYKIDQFTNRTFEEVKNDFITAVHGCMMSPNEVTQEDISYLVQYYTEYSCLYLQAVAMTLEEPKGVSATMKYMNSYIATFVTEAGYHYYNKEQGYSIIDKAVQAALDNDGIVSEEQLYHIMTEIEDSYIEEEFEEEQWDEEATADIPLSVDET